VNWTYGQLSLYPDEKKHAWIKRVSPFVYARTGRDRTQGGDILFGLLGVRANFTRQGFFRVDTNWGQEPWAQREWATRGTRVMGSAQLLRWLNVEGRASFGREVYYDAEAPFVGPSRSHAFTLTVQPGPSLSQGISWEQYQMSRDGGGRVFRVDLLNLRTTYQFDRRFALRGIVRYDSSARRVLTDFLASFEPVPGTVAYAGYGSVLEQRGWNGSSWQQPGGEYRTMRRGLFLKASYAKRF
jgi:hypothetical protein